MRTFIIFTMLVLCLGCEPKVGATPPKPKPKSKPDPFNQIVKDRVFFDASYNKIKLKEVAIKAKAKIKENPKDPSNYIDHATVHLLVDNTTKAHQILDNALSNVEVEKAKAVVYANKALVYSIQGKTAKEDTTRKDFYSKALRFIKKANFASPGVLEFSSMYEAYAALAEDQLELATATKARRALDKEEGKQISISGSVMIVGILSSAFVTVYLASEKDTRQLLIKTMPKILEGGARLVATIKMR